MNPYKNKWCLAVMGALVRRSHGPERNPERAARIHRRFSNIIAWAQAVDAEGEPLDGSFWVRKSTCRVWQVQWIEKLGTMVRIRLPGTRETELHSLDYLFEHFFPEHADAPRGRNALDAAIAEEKKTCAACEGDVTFPHDHD